MNAKHNLEFIATAIAAALVGFGCNKPQSGSAPPPEPMATNASAPARPVPADNGPAAAAGGAEVTREIARVLTPEEARNHVGEVATVRGKVFGVHVTRNGDVFLNFGAAFPNQLFTAVCFQGAIPTADLKQLNGRTISVKGRIKDYNGQIEIVLERAEQISE